MISTNSVKPKENHKWDKFLEEQKIDGKPTGNIISHIPSPHVHTSQESFQKRKLPLFPSVFPGVRKVEQKKTDRTFIQSQDLRDIERQKQAAMAKAQRAAIKAKAEQEAQPKKRPGRKPKAKA